MKNKNKLFGFSFSKNMAIFEAFCKATSSSINFLFLKSVLYDMYGTGMSFVFSFCIFLSLFLHRICSWSVRCFHEKKMIWFFEDIKRASNERCPYTCAQSSAITSFARRWRYIFLAHHMPHWTNNSKKSVKFFFKNIDFFLWVNWLTYLKERSFKMYYFKIFSSLSTVHIKY